MPRLPPLYSYEELRALAQANEVSNWDTMDIRVLAEHLWKAQIITQEMLDARQAVLLAELLANEH
jgi:hypothetical protein